MITEDEARIKMIVELDVDKFLTLAALHKVRYELEGLESSLYKQSRAWLEDHHMTRKDGRPWLDDAVLAS